MALPDKSWDSMTEDEKREWEKAAAENGPKLIGGMTVPGKDFCEGIRAQRWREDVRRGKIFY